MSDTLSPGQLAAVVRCFAEGLERHEGTLNRLNVYPVPDGDTGTNMLATVRAADDALAELLAGEPGASMAAVCATLGRAALMGARGNSGVILCQVLRALGQAFSDLEAIDAPTLAAGIDAGARAARQAVGRPVEGTILTVADAAAAGAGAGRDGGLAAVIGRAETAAREALWSTPDLLPVLAEAGVVDAGGAGLLLLFDALGEVALGQPPLEELPLPASVREALGSIGPVIEARAHAGESELRYEVMYLLEAEDAALPGFREVWAGLGDSIVVVGGEGLWNCHIHTDEIGPVIEAALDVGRPREIRVTDLSEQVAEEHWVRAAAAAAQVAAEPEAGEVRRCAVVTVASGEGIARILRSLGVATIVPGGQSMNPSTAELLAAIEIAPAHEVVVLPNNTNIYPVAHQAAELADKRVVVVETPGVQEAFAALLEYDPEADAPSNGAAMAASAAHVRAGEVTQAVRASQSAAGPIAVGDWIALGREGIVGVAKSPEDATCALLDALAADGGEIVTVIEGADATESASRAIAEWLAAHHPGLALERHRGGQPLYPYLVAVE